MAELKFEGGPASEGDVKLAQSELPEDLGGLVARALAEAAESLWRFYRRPLPDGGSWGVVSSCRSLRDFASNLVSMDKLLYACLDLEDHSLLDAQERSSLKVAASLGRALGLHQSATGPKERWSRPDDAHPTVGSLACHAKQGENTRTEPRINTSVGADLRVGTTYYRVKMRNSSRVGTMIEGVRGLRAGDAAALKIQDGWRSGKIVWAVAERAGLAFESA